jgi:hypothetical protein
MRELSIFPESKLSKTFFNPKKEMGFVAFFVKQFSCHEPPIG